MINPTLERNVLKKITKSVMTAKELSEKLRVHIDDVYEILEKNKRILCTNKRWYCIKWYLDENRDQKNYPFGVFRSEVLFFLDSGVLKFLKTHNICYEDVLTENPMDDIGYLKKTGENLMKTRCLRWGELSFLLYAKNAVLNYVRLLLYLDYPSIFYKRSFLNWCFGYPSDKQVKAGKGLNYLIHEARKGLPSRPRKRKGPQRLSDQQREDIMTRAVVSLLRKINDTLDMDQLAIINGGNQISVPDINIALDDRNLRGIVELKAFFSKYKEGGGQQVFPQLIKYCGIYNFVWLISTSELSLSGKLTLTGKKSRAARSLDLKPARELSGESFMDLVSYYVEEIKQKEKGIEPPSKVSFHASDVGKHLLGMTTESDFQKLADDFVRREEHLHKRSPFQALLGKFSDAIEEYSEEITGKRILFLPGNSVIELLRKDPKSLANYETLSKEYDLILAISEIDDLLELLQKYRLGAQAKAIKSLVKEDI